MVAERSEWRSTFPRDKGLRIASDRVVRGPIPNHIFAPYSRLTVRLQPPHRGEHTYALNLKP
jgi:hypothetical protein